MWMGSEVGFVHSSSVVRTQAALVLSTRTRAISLVDVILLVSFFFLFQCFLLQRLFSSRRLRHRQVYRNFTFRFVYWLVAHILHILNFALFFVFFSCCCFQERLFLNARPPLFRICWYGLPFYAFYIPRGFSRRFPNGARQEWKARQTLRGARWQFWRPTLCKQICGRGCFMSLSGVISRRREQERKMDVCERSRLLFKLDQLYFILLCT